MSAVLSGCFASPPQIIALEPSRGSVGVPADSPIQVQFDRPVAPQTVASRFSVDPPIADCDLSEAFASLPTAACTIRWLNGNTRFVLDHPRAVLEAGQRYTFTLAGGFADPQGDVNTIDHRWEITTGTAPEVRAMSPGSGTVVAADLPLTVTFSGPMAAGTTRSAISLYPAVPGTRVVRSPRDHSRFIVLPGRPLLRGVAYELRVDRSATDEHGQHLAASVQTGFMAGGLSDGPHAVVLAGARGRPATEVVIAAITSGEAGDPAAPETVLSAPTCPQQGGCGDAHHGDPLYTYSAAALAPNAEWLATVEHDDTVAASPPVLVVIQLGTGAAVATIAQGTLPAWSPDSSALAFAHGGRPALFRVDTRAVFELPDGDPLAGPPSWGPRGEIMALASRSASGATHVELGDALVGARYAVPGLTGNAEDPRISPDGTQLALYRGEGADQGTWLAGVGSSGAPPRKLDADLHALCWADAGTLLAVAGARAGHAALVQVSVVGDSRLAITPAPPADSLDSISASGRLFAFITAGPLGVRQAMVEGMQGGAPAAVTAFTSSALDALSVEVS